MNADLRLPSATIVDISGQHVTRTSDKVMYRHMLGNAGNSVVMGNIYSTKSQHLGLQCHNVTLTVSGQELCMEIDTGASLSLVSEVTYKKLWPGTPLVSYPCQTYHLLGREATCGKPRFTMTTRVPSCLLWL